MQKKILLFIESGGPGGAEKVVLETAINLAKSNFAVTVCTLRCGWLTDNLKNAGINHLHLESKNSFDFGLIFRLASLIKKEKFELLHSHLLDSNFYCSLASFIAGVPHIASDHGDVHHLHLKKFSRLKLKIISLLPTQMTAVSNFTAQQLKVQGYNSPVTVTGNPITNSFQQSLEVRENVRNSFALKAEDFLWLNIANLRVVKDQVTLIKGFAKAYHENKKQMLVILGEGPERVKLETLINNLELSNQVKLLGFCNDLNPYLQAADGFILSSKSEALPLSLLEAGLAGLVTVATNVGGIPEIIENNVNGFLFEKGNDQQLADHLLRVYKDQKTARKMSEVLRGKIKSNFSWESYLEKLNQLYF